MIPLPVIFALVSAVAGFTGAYFWQEANYERRIADIHSAHASQLAESTRDALARTVAFQAAKDEAEHRAAARLAVSRRDAAANSNALARLRDTITDTAPVCVSSDTKAAPGANTDPARELLAQCAGVVADMAREADGHLNDKLMLLEAWPRQ